MNFWTGLIIVFCLISSGLLMFSLAAGFSLYPVLVKRLYNLLFHSGSEDSFCDDRENGGDTILSFPKDQVKTRSLMMKFHRKILKGNIILPGNISSGEKDTIKHIILMAGSGTSLPDIGITGENFPSDTGIFFPESVEKFCPGKGFSFGVKDGQALKAWKSFLKTRYPGIKISLAGSFCGGASVIFCASHCRKDDFLQVVADSPYFSVPFFMNKEIASVFPGFLRRRLLFLGVLLASVFFGTPVFYQKPFRYVKKILKNMAGCVREPFPVSLCFDCALNGVKKEKEFFSAQYILYKKFFLRKKKKIYDIFPLKTSEEMEKLHK